jgi:hypothetical protein
MIRALFTLSLIGFLFGGIAQNADASTTPSGTAVNPWLVGRFDDATSTVLTVAGHGFTPSGKIYLALYDQAGAQLYEHRTVTASAALSAIDASAINAAVGEHVQPSSGGEVNEVFDGLCGSAIMVRALDETTQVWSDWLTVNSSCARAATTASDGNAALTLPVANPSAFAIATGILGDPPVLLDATDASANATDRVFVSGFDFTAGRRVYLAVYDQMGARLYPAQWLMATPQYTITGMSDDSPEAHPIVSAEKGTFLVSFAHACGDSVMARAYDQATETWSNWINVAASC